MHVILATQAAEIRRTSVQSLPRQIVWDPISKKPITKKSRWNGSRYRLWVQTPVPNNNKMFLMKNQHVSQ
jgi:hypothetical protein